MSETIYRPKFGLSRSEKVQDQSESRRLLAAHGVGQSGAHSIAPNETQRLLDQQDDGYAFNSFASVHDMASDAEASTVDFQTRLQTFKDKSDILFHCFHETLMARTNESEVFDTIQDLIQICSDIYDDGMKDAYYRGYKIAHAESSWLEQELNTWKLLYALYKDRILLQVEAGMEFDTPALGCSEREIVTQLYTTKATLREYQLIVDWLEVCYVKEGGVQTGHSTDSTVAWENTLFQLQNPKGVAFGSGLEIVQSLDPDAPAREGRPLHALDDEDNARLSRCIFTEIRQGRIDEAMALCKYCGQSWRAAILEGWRLHEDPNYESQNTREKMPIVGNPNRDIWKKCAWMMADNKKFDEYTRAIAGTFCGHLEALKSVVGSTWEDLLWAYLKVQIDIRVEEEIRSCCLKSFHEMPNAYWENRMALEEIFEELCVHKDAMVRNVANGRMGTIQKYLILDNVSELLQHMNSWMNNDEENDSDAVAPPLTAHMLRFLTHIVLFMRQIGKVDKEQPADNIIATYVDTLIARGDAQLVAFYSAAVPRKMQLTLYSKFLCSISELPARSIAVTESNNHGLSTESIIRHAVESIRNEAFANADAGSGEKVKAGEISVSDRRAIRALEFLTFCPEHSGELLWQTNATIRIFLGEGKHDCAREAYQMVPADALGQLFSMYGDVSELPCREACSVKEFLSYKVYLAAIDNFNDWSHRLHNQPKEPHVNRLCGNFTERLASEHKEQLYQVELNNWKCKSEKQSKITRDSLYNILLFPENGWLVDPDTIKLPVGVSQTEWNNRLVQLEKLRSICIPEVVMLLYKLLQHSGDHRACVMLANDISSENNQIYKVYTKHKLAELLSKLSESSLSLLNDKLDPFGFTVTS